MNQHDEHIAKQKKPFSARGLPVLIGSLPVQNHAEGLELIFAHTPDIPLWPQLPGNPLEGMLSQFCEGFPGLVEENGRTYFDAGRDNFEADQLAFFEDYLAAVEDYDTLLTSSFAISRSRAAGLYSLKEAIAARNGITAVKGQITGPFTVLTGLKDVNRRDAYYDPAIREIVVKGLALKAAWQVAFLKDAGVPVLVFIDEPALAGLGSSSFISIALNDIARDLGEVIAAVQQAGGLAGIHVCANTDWSFLLSLNLDILSFDAYGFFDRLLVSRAELYAFLDRGGIIAWGIVPTSEEAQIRKETARTLAERWEDQAGRLVNEQWSLEKLLAQTLITPSCGTGSLSLELASKVLELSRDTSALLRNRYSK